MNSKKKNLLSWLVYDGANSFLTTSIGGLFLAQWIVLDKGLDDIWYGTAFSLATILVLISSPFFGAWSDRIGKRLPFIKWVTIFLIILSGLLAFIVPSNIEIKTRLFLIVIIAVLIQYFYQLSLIFYNSLLEVVSTDKNRGAITGLGEVFGNSSGILASALFLQFASQKITIFGEPGRAQVFFPAFILFTILSLPILLLFKEKEPIKIKKVRVSFKDVYTKTIEGFKNLFSKNKNVAIFLVAFSLISDVLLTGQLYFAIVLDKLYGVADTEKFIISTLLLVIALISSFFLGKLGDRIGNKLILVFSCIILIISLTMIFTVPPIWILYPIIMLMGLGWGGFYVSSRVLMIKLSPKEELGEYFGFFSTFYRIASIVGPTVWGLVTLSFKHLGDYRYRLAGYSLVFIMLVGTYLLRFVKEKRIV